MQTSTKSILNNTLIQLDRGYAVLLNPNDAAAGQLLAAALSVEVDEDGDLRVIQRNTAEVRELLELVDDDGDDYWARKQNLGLGYLEQRGHRLLVPEQAEAVWALRKLDRATAEQYLETRVTACLSRGHAVPVQRGDALLPAGGGCSLRLAVRKDTLDTDYLDSDAGQGRTRTRASYVEGRSMSAQVLLDWGN